MFYCILKFKYIALGAPLWDTHTHKIFNDNYAFRWLHQVTDFIREAAWNAAICKLARYAHTSLTQTWQLHFYRPKKGEGCHLQWPRSCHPMKVFFSFQLLKVSRTPKFHFKHLIWISRRCHLAQLCTKEATPSHSNLEALVKMKGLQVIPLKNVSHSKRQLSPSKEDLQFNKELHPSPPLYWSAYWYLEC